MNKRITQAFCLLMAISFSLQAFSQTTIDYTTWSSAACNAFTDVSIPATVNGVSTTLQHVATLGAPTYSTTDHAVVLSYENFNTSTASYNGLSGTAYIVYVDPNDFTPCYNYQVTVTARYVGSGGSAPILAISPSLSSQGDAEVGIGQTDPVRYPCSSNTNLPIPVNNSGNTFSQEFYGYQEQSTSPYVNHTISSTSFTTYQYNFTNIGYTYKNLSILAEPSSGEATNLSNTSIEISNIQIVATPIFNLSPATVTQACSTYLSQTFTVSNACQGADSYTWNLGSTTSGWYYGGVPVTTSTLTTTTNAITLTSAPGGSATPLSNITASAIIGSTTYPAVGTAAVTFSNPPAPTVTVPTICIGNSFGSTVTLPIPNYPGYGTITLSYPATNPLSNINFLTTGTYTPTLSGSVWSIAVTVIPTTGTTYQNANYNIVYNNGSCTSAATTFAITNSPPPILTATANGITNTITVNPLGSGLDEYDCIPLNGGAQTSFVLTTPAQTGYTYSWSFGTTNGVTSNGWTAVGATGSAAPYTLSNSNTLTIPSTSFNNQPGLVILSVTNSCGATISYPYTIGRFTPYASPSIPLPSNITSLINISSSTTLPGLPVTATVTSTGSTQASLNPFIWSGPTGWTFVNNGNGVTTITPPANAPVGTYTVNASLQSANSYSGCYNNNTLISYSITIGYPIITINANGVTNTVYPAGLPTPLSGYDAITLNGGTQTPAILTVTSPISGYTYTWSYGTSNGTASNGWNTSPVGSGTAPYTFTGTTLTIPSSSFNNQPGQVVLTVSDGHGNTISYPYTIGRYLPYASPSTSPVSNLIPLITVPSCITAGSSGIATLLATGSTQVNLNTFTWSGPSAWTFVNNANGTTTITPPITTAAGTYTVYASLASTNSYSGFYNNNASIPYTIVVGSYPNITVTANGSTNTINPVGIPSILSGYDAITLNGGTQTSAVFSVLSPIAGYTYTWSFGTSDGTISNGWNTSPASTGTAPYTYTGSTLTISSSTFNNQPGKVILTVTDACGGVTSYPYTIARYLPYASPSISPASNLIPLITVPSCITAGSSGTATLLATGSTQVNLNTFTWSGPSGWTFVNHANGTTTITPPITTTAGTYTVYASLASTNGYSGFYNNSASIPYSIVVGSYPNITVTANGSTNTINPVGLPTILAGYDAITLNGGTQTPAVFSVVSPIAGYTYMWSFGTSDGTTSNGWNTSPASTGTAPYNYTGSTLTISSSTFNNQPGKVILTVTDACGGVTSYPYTIGRYLPYASPSTSPASNLIPLITVPSCITAGSSGTATLLATGSTQVNLNTFTWSGPSGWTFVNHANGTTTIIPPITMTAGTYTVYASLTSTNGYSGFYNNSASIPYSIVIGSYPNITVTANGSTNTINPVGLPTILAGYDAITLNGGTQTPAVFSVVSPIAGYTYTWSFGTSDGTTSNGWNTSPESTGTAPYNYTGSTLTISSSTFNNQPGKVILTVTDACGGVTSYPYTIGRYLPYASPSTSPASNLIPLITVPSCVAAGNSITATLLATGSTQVNLNTFSWSGPSGWTFVNHTDGTTTITPPITTTPGSYTVYASLASINGYSGFYNNNASIPYTLNIGGITPVVTLPSCIGNGFINPATNAIANITINNYAGYGSYTLAYDASATGANTNILTESPAYAPTLTSAGSWVISVPIKNACNEDGTGGAVGNYLLSYNSGGCAAATPVIVSDVSPFTIAQENPFDPSLNEYFLTASNSAIVPYTWYDCSTNIVQSSPEMPSESWLYKIGDDGTDGSTTLFSAQATALNGCLYRSTINPIGAPFGFRPAFTPTGIISKTDDLINIYPNPSQGDFTINIQKVLSKASVSLYEDNGRIISEISLIQGANHISERQLASGEYYLIIIIDGQTYYNNIIIAK